MRHSNWAALLLVVTGALLLSACTAPGGKPGCPPPGPWPQPPGCEGGPAVAPAGTPGGVSQPATPSGTAPAAGTGGVSTGPSAFGVRTYNASHADLIERRGWYSATHYAVAETGLLYGGFSGYLWSDYVASPKEVASTTVHARMARGLGKIVGASIGLNGPGSADTQEFAARFVTPNDRVVDLDGNVVTRGRISATDAGGWPYYSIYSANYTAYLKNALRNAVDAGLDGATFDDELYMYSGQWVAGNPEALDALREHLAAHPAADLKARFGISDLATYDLRAQLRRDVAAGFGNPPPLLAEYLQVLSNSTLQKLIELRDYAKALAAEKGRTFLFSGNTVGLYPYWMRFVPAYDYSVGEWFQNGADSTRAPGMDKLLEAVLPGKPALLAVQWNLNGAPPPDDATAFARAVAADVYSTGKAAWLSAGNEIGTTQGGVFQKPPSFDYAVTDAWTAALRGYPEIFEGLGSPHAEVGLLYALPTMLPAHGWFGYHYDDFPGRSDRSFWGAGMLLSDAAVPYDVVFLGDPRMGVQPQRLDAATLATHKALVLDQVFALSDADVAALLAYARDGGTLVLLDRFATHDEKGILRPRKELADITTPGVHPLGAGKVVFVADNLGVTYSRDAYAAHTRAGSTDTLAAFRRQVVAELGTPALQELPPGVGLSSYESANGTVQFLVSYRFDFQANRPGAAVDMAVRVPPGQAAFVLVDASGPARPVRDGDRIRFQDGAALYFPRDGQPPRGPAAAAPKAKLVYDDANGSPFSLTWEGAARLNPRDPLSRAMRAYKGLLDRQFDVVEKSKGALTAADLSGARVLLLDTPATLSAAESAVLRDFVAQGGRVGVFYGDGPCPSEANSFLRGYGLAFDCRGSLKVFPMRDRWWNVFYVTDFPAFRIDPVRVEQPRAVEVSPPAVAMAESPADVYLDQNGNDRPDPGEPYGPHALLGVYRNATSGGMVAAYGDHSQQDIALDGGYSMQLHIALLDLLASGAGDGAVSK